MTTIVLDIGNQARRDHAIRVIQRLPEARAWDVTIGEHVNKRSSNQNARLWALHKLAGDHLGYASEEMHELALCRFFGHVTIKVGGISRDVPLKRSSARNSKEFAEFMERTETWYVTDFGVFLP